MAADNSVWLLGVVAEASSAEVDLLLSATLLLFERDLG